MLLMLELAWNSRDNGVDIIDHLEHMDVQAPAG